MDNYYWYGQAALMYMLTCWVFSIVRVFHTGQIPKKLVDYIWPDRKAQIIIYAGATVLLPYIYNPACEAAWLLEKTYFPCTYYFYCGLLLYYFFGTLKQRNGLWRKVTLIAGCLMLVAMVPLIAHAWLRGGLFSPSGARLWSQVCFGVSLVLMVYAGWSMRKMWLWIKEARDDNYSNPDDFPIDYARRVWLAPVLFTPMLWPAYLLDSPDIMAVMNVLLAISNIILLLMVMPAWRRKFTMVTIDDNEQDDEQDVLAEERTNRIAAEIELFVKIREGYLNPHLRLEHVVARCSYSRSYVSKVFQDRFGGFSNYVNGLRLEHYEKYIKEHPEATMDTAAQASGFTTYRAYYRAKEKVRTDSL